MQITRDAHSCRLGSQAEFFLGPGESKSTKRLQDRKCIGSLLTLCECQMNRFLTISLCDTL